MIICGQLARAKAATDLRIFMCSGSLGLFIAPLGLFIFAPLYCLPGLVLSGHLQFYCLCVHNARNGDGPPLEQEGDPGTEAGMTTQKTLFCSGLRVQQ